MKTTVNREDSFKSKLAYGFADIYGGGCFLVLFLLFIVFLTDVVGMSAALAGVIPLVGKIWDAITDPIMGNIVDRTESKLGKKRLWILVGSIFALLTFFLMWIKIPVDSNGSQVGSFIFYLLMYMLVSTAFTIVMVPYNALLPDMVEDYSKRASYNAVRMIFSALSAILAGALPTIMLGWFNNSYFIVALIFAVLFGISVFITYLGTWEKPTPTIKVPLKKTFSQSLSVYKNRSFRRYLGIFLFGQGSSDFVTTLAIYFIVVVLHPGQANYNSNYLMIMGSILGAQLLSMFVFNIIASKTSKKLPLYIGFPIRIAATALLVVSLFTKVNVIYVAILSFISGIGSASSSITSYAILSDAYDIDELITSKRRSGLVSSMSTFTRKVATGLASAACGLIVTISGYDAIRNLEEINSSSNAQHALRDWFMNNANSSQALFTKSVIGWAYVIIPIIFMIFILIYLSLYKANKKEM